MIFLGTSENNLDKILRLSLNDWTILDSDDYICLYFPLVKKTAIPANTIWLLY